jgi:hypothetical protein
MNFLTARQPEKMSTPKDINRVYPRFGQFELTRGLLVTFAWMIVRFVPIT